MKGSLHVLFLLGSFLCSSGNAQNVEVLVLGIAQDAGHPQIGCDKNCCKAAFEDPSLSHYTASLGISNGERFFLIDATPDIAPQLYLAQRHFQGQSLGGVFLTHAHIGHYTGLMHFGREAMSSLDMPVYAMPRMSSFLTSNAPWDQLTRIHNIELRMLEDERAEMFGLLSVTPLEVPHRDEYSETVGFLLQGPDKSLIYIPDIDKWENWDRNMERLVKSVDYLLLDGTFYDGDELPGRNMAEIPHPFVTETLELFESFPEEERNKVHFIHLNHTNPMLRGDSKASQVVEAMGMHICERGMSFAL